jgi:outer membrane receptor protein involved in Fe transport
MKNFVLILLALWFFRITVSYAQDNPFIKDKSGSITGIVKDSKDNSPIEADVHLFFSKDSIKISGGKCDSQGRFKLSSLQPGIYKIELNAVGYASRTIDNIKVQENEAVVLDSVIMKKQEVTTGEVLVEDLKPILTFEGDKKVFNVDQSMLNKGGTALDLLKKVPLIDVDINDNVTLRGSTNVKILIDDKPNRYVNLKQLPSESIEKVEIITNPPAKYEAEGVTGIINIVLKKNDRVGFNGNVYVNAGSKDQYSGGLEMNLKKKNLAFFGSGYIGIYRYEYGYTNSTQYFTPVSFLDGSGFGNSKGKYFGGNFGTEYEFRKGHTLGLEGNLNKSNYNNGDNSQSINKDSLANITSFYTKYNTYDGNWRSYSISLYYNGKLNEKGRELSADITYSGSGNKNTAAYLNQYYDANGAPINNTPLRQNDLTDNKSYNINVQADYTHPINEKSKFEAGYKGTFRTNDNNFNSDTLDYSINTYVNNAGISNHFKLSDRINAIYAAYSGGIGKFSFKLGLRVEQTYTKGELLTGGESFTKNYTDFFPAINLSQKIGLMNQLQLSYSRRITRPGIFRLNPFIYKSDPRFIRYGNPHLNPEFTDAYELSFMFYSKIITVTPMAFFRRSHDIISSYSYLIDSNVSATTYLNAAGSKAYGMDIILSSQTIDWLSLNGTVSLYDTKFDEDAFTDYAAEEGFSWKANIRSSIKLMDLFSIELYYNYTGKRINAQGTSVPTQQLNVSLSKTFLKDKATVTLSANDIFKTMHWGQDVNAVGYKSSFRNNSDFRSVYLNISYRFGNTEEYYQKKKKTKQNQNENNDQNDNGNGR